MINWNKEKNRHWISNGVLQRHGNHKRTGLEKTDFEKTRSVFFFWGQVDLIFYCKKESVKMNYTYQKDFDTRDHSEIYVMKITSQLSKEEFLAINKEIKEIGGYYSTFKKGFLFREDVRTQIEKKYKNELLSSQDISDLKHISIEDYCNRNNIELTGNGRWRSLKEHDSCVIDTVNNNFYWNSRQRNGDIINFLEEYHGIGFKEAVEILGEKKVGIAYKIKPYQEDSESNEKKDSGKLLFELNEQKEMKHVYAYLKKERKIDYQIIQEFIGRGLIREDEKRNIIFKTFQEDDSKKELIAFFKKGSNSNKHYEYISPHSQNVGFRFRTTDLIETMYVYEAPIDLMSHYEMNRETLIKKNAILVAMTGLKPNAVLNNIERYNPKKIVFCVDNDKAGKEFIEKMEKLIPENLKNHMEILVPEKKDWNEDLKEKKTNDELEEIKKFLKQAKEKADSILQNPFLMQEYMEFCERFHSYSNKNQMLLYLQNPSATFIGSRSFFKEMGFSLKKEELSNFLIVISPNIKEFFIDQSGQKKSVHQATKEEKEEIEKGNIKLEKDVSFQKTRVYDITQTSAEKKDYPTFLHREQRNFTDSNIDPKRTLIGMVNQLRREGYQVELEDLSNPELRIGTKGYTNTFDKIVLNRYDKTENQIATLLHEYAHCVLHNSSQISNAIQKNVIEFEAESISYLCLERYQLPSNQDSPLYLTNYGKEIIQKMEENKMQTSFSHLDVLKNIHRGLQQVTSLLENNITIAASPEEEPRHFLKKEKINISFLEKEMQMKL